MPTYDYKCNACGHTFEEFQSMSAPHLKKCPKCGKNKLERLIGTGAALMFKGSGFYITDYRSDSYKKAAEADKGGGAAGKGDSAKPEPAKAEPAAASKPESAASGKSESKSSPGGESKAASKPSPSQDPKPKSRKSAKSD